MVRLVSPFQGGHVRRAAYGERRANGVWQFEGQHDAPVLLQPRLKALMVTAMEVLSQINLCCRKEVSKRQAFMMTVEKWSKPD